MCFLDFTGHPWTSFWWAHQDSNLEPKDYESSALTIELWALCGCAGASCTRMFDLRVIFTPFNRRGRTSMASGIEAA